jgi:sec-independent protein translocase protein TatC
VTEDQQMTLVQHLRELRYRLIMSILGIGIGMGLCVWQSELLLDFVRAPVLPYLGHAGGLVFTGVMDKFMVHLKIGALGGLILTCPWWLFQVWRFISPGLYMNERRFAAGFIVSGTILFMAGVCFVYFLVYPAAFKYLFGIGGDIDKPMITINEYISFFATTTVMFGVAFELPLILVILALMGVIDAEFLRRQRRFAIPIMAVLTAFITPPDMVSMLLLLVPMCLLYESSILVIQFLLPRRKLPEA